MANVVRLCISLAAIGGVCGLLLVGTYRLTAEDIDLNREARARALMTSMLGHPLPVDHDVQADISGHCDAWLFSKINVNGYTGEIRVLALWRAQKDKAPILTLRVLQHSETPGIGDFIDHARDPWITQWDGQTGATYGAIDNVSGATVTSNAIKRAAAAALNQSGVHCELDS